MQRFYINSVTDRGRQYYMVNYPGDRSPWSRKPARRVQKKFNSLERAQEFLCEIKREWAKTGKIRLGLDSHLHGDVLRSMKLLSGIANATLERAVYVFLQCVSLAEKRDMKYEVALDRRVELSPRLFLLVQNEARERKVTVSEAAEGLLAELALRRAEGSIREEVKSEESGYRELKRRNDIEREKLRELARQAKIWEEYGRRDMVFEQGRRSVLMKKAEYQRRWREQKKEREAKAREEASSSKGNGNGNRDLQ